jgi:uncharacterized membrane protein YfcA
MHLQLWQWPLAIAGALLIGLSKTGIPGVGIFPVALFALVYPATESAGLVLPLLICADIVAVKSYHRHAQWKHLWRLFPWAAGGIVIGFFAVKFLDKSVTTKIIGATLLLMVALHLWRKYSLKDEQVPRGWVFSSAMGLAGGFTTMIANAAGPIMALYLLAMQLPKMEFIGTGAWYFFVLNSFKVPFQMGLKNINMQSLALDGVLVPFVVAGALWGRVLLPRLNQKLFENLALVFAALAGVKLVFF